MIPGEIIPLDLDIIINKNKTTITLDVLNNGGRPIQVGSHLHFFETNKLLNFDRKLSYGMRLNIPAGTAVRFEPYETKTIELVEIGGKRKVMGANNLVDGYLSESREQAMSNLKVFIGEDK